jgi:hypothetical protein
MQNATTTQIENAATLYMYTAREKDAFEHAYMVYALYTHIALNKKSYEIKEAAYDAARAIIMQDKRDMTTAIANRCWSISAHVRDSYNTANGLKRCVPVQTVLN